MDRTTAEPYAPLPSDPGAVVLVLVLRTGRRVVSETWREWVLNGLLASPLVPRELRWKLFQLYGFPVERCAIGPHCWFGSRRVTIGRGTRINMQVTFNTNAPVVLGSGVQVGFQTTFVTSTHVIGDADGRAGRAEAHPIHIGDGSWIGARCLILPGVTVGAGCVIAGGSVVVKDCEPDTLYAGSPARRVRSLPAGSEPRRALLPTAG